MFRIFTFIAIAFVSYTASAQSIERPTAKIGDECSYDIFDNLAKDSNGNPEKIAERRGVVTLIDDGKTSFNWTSKILVSRDTEDIEDGRWILDKDFNVIDRNDRKFDPPYPGRFYPLTPGTEKKAVKTAFPRQQRDGNSTAEFDGKASNWESVSVPSGKFDVITITWDGWYNTNRGIQRWSGRIYQQLSLSPSTHCLIMGTYRSYRGNGGVWTDRNYKLTSYKN